jgi:hypothetical protein
MKERVKIEVGQVWADCDKRMTGRTVKVVRLVDRWDQVRNRMGYCAVCEVLTKANSGRPAEHTAPENKGKGIVGQTVTIRVDRMHPCSTGFRLVEPAKPEVTLADVYKLFEKNEKTLTELKEKVRDLQAQIDRIPTHRYNSEGLE